MNWPLGFLTGGGAGWVALILSIALGVRAAVVFDDKGQAQSQTPTGTQTEPWIQWRRCLQGALNFVSNFSGSFTGWFCVYVLAVRLKSSAAQNFACLGAKDLVLLLIALMGVSGSLVQLTVALLGAVGKVAEALAQKLAK